LMKSTKYLPHFLILIALLGLPALTAASGISGRVVDAEDNPAGGVLVLVLDGETGVPVLSNGKPFHRQITSQPFPIAASKTSTSGEFEISVPEGSYRLVAQRWSGETKLWDGGMGRFEHLEEFGPVIELFGRTGPLTVPSDSANNVLLAPPGNATLKITCDPQIGNNETIVVFGDAACLLPPEKGFEGWTGDFLCGALGFNRMPHGETTVRNLPRGRSVHLVAFANDNKPGYAVEEVIIPDEGDSEVTMHIHADWSDAH
ncbi:MAG: carboxypeptidase regulatory-like domain-containing protein, partial [Candidatus Sumerlaeia bacterium]|nr:carboxypeptidase regulatory-like domain-containing protein [Candidatus Sumerlaeia bacterium]